jgi:hypothetical protein
MAVQTQAKTVWKFDAPINDDFDLLVPFGAQVLCVQNQHDRPCIWFTVDPDQSRVYRHFHWAGTGHRLLQNVVLQYIGSVQMLQGDLVFHLFEEV